MVINKRILFLVVISCFLCVGFVQGFSGDGSGTELDPYQISTCDQLQDIEDNLSAYYILINDVDCYDTLNWSGGNGFKPIGNGNNPFTGSFDGRDHTINDLHIINTTSLFVGLFGFVNYSVIKNVGLTNVYVRGVMTNVGGLVGSLSCSVINNTFVTGNVFGSGDVVGGLVGDIYSYTNVTSSIYNSYFKGNVTTSCSAVGGLVGHAYENYHIGDSYAVANVSGYSHVGGFVGFIANGTPTVKNCFSDSYVTGNFKVGGFVGRNEDSKVENSYWNNISTNLPGIGFGGVGDGGSLIVVQDDSSYFYDSSNQPISSWNLDDNWDVLDGYGYPSLKWQNAYVDTDSDGVIDLEDNINGYSDDIQTNIENLTFVVDNQTDPVSANETATVEFKEENETIVSFEYNFTDDLDLTNINITKQEENASEGFIIITGIDLREQEDKKTVYIDKILGSDTICIKDAEISSISEISSGCDGTNETLVSCPTGGGKYTCEIVGERYEISGLKHSGVLEFTADSDNDGVIDSEDRCPDTTEEAASQELLKNHYADVDSDNIFETMDKSIIDSEYTMIDTFGCSCSQILGYKSGNNDGEYKHGCTKGTMNNWTK